MSTIKNIAVHHSGGLGSDQFASTRHLTFNSIENAHAGRRDWFGYHAHLSSLGYHVGYNFVYDPKTREFTQARAIGEETLAQVGYNFNTISICIIGNYMRKPLTQESVDPMTLQMEADIAHFIRDLINGNKRSYIVAEGTQLSLSESRVYAHRVLQPTTNCYGTFLLDNWARDLLTEYSVIEVQEDDTIVLQERLMLYVTILKLYQKIVDLKMQIQKMSLGFSPHEKSCSGFISE